VTKDEIKQLIVERVSEKAGLKAVHLASEEDIVLACKDLPSICEELVEEGRLVEVEYVLPEMDWRIKSFYLPAGTVVRVRSK
jgi:hypothetical protein